MAVAKVIGFFSVMATGVRVTGCSSWTATVLFMEVVTPDAGEMDIPPRTTVSGFWIAMVGVETAFPADVVEDAEEPVAPMTSFSRIAAIWDFIGVASDDTPSTADSVFGLTATTGVLIFSGTMVPMVTLVDCIEEPSLVGVLVKLIVFDSEGLTGVGVHLPATMVEPDGQDLPSEAILVRKA